MMELPITMNTQEIVGLFLFLRARESELDSVLSALHERLSGHLYERLSIDEMENLQDLYAQKIDVLEQKG
ncbi:hypothetical protein [Marispirochaeta sp.]|jgi:hypothetical protein|uniref:hypothetical protein n=1 Tax=Marispirochaeta sp. TaxID=2038653 RepID=UPI0029C925B3|nr:hypothetical protein [Marispirochaeta sp.]